MAIKQADFVKFLLAAHDVMPELSKLVRPEHFYKHLGYIRGDHNVFTNEFISWQLYPSYNMDRFKETRENLLRLCGEAGIEMIVPIPNDLELNQKTWGDYCKVKHIVRYFYEGVDITKIMDI